MAILDIGWRGAGLFVAPSFAVIATIAGMTAGLGDAHGDAPAQKPAACESDNGGLTLSPGFCATVFADNLGHVRHMVAAADGTLYANTWSGCYFPNAPPPPGGFRAGPAAAALRSTTTRYLRKKTAASCAIDSLRVRRCRSGRPPWCCPACR